MDAVKQQIIGYFIQETRDNLDILEKGLLHLQEVIEDPESINSLFRAAHSIKGGAAMLGLTSIQKLAHWMEGCLKIAKEHPIQVDQATESMFLSGFDKLQDLLKHTQDPRGLSEEEGDQAVAQMKPLFERLQAHLTTLAKQAVPVAEAFPARPVNLIPEVMPILRQMLTLFKQPESPQTRQQLLAVCDSLTSLGADLETWQTLVGLAKQAIANPANSHRLLAPIVIKEIKGAADLIVAGKAATLAPSLTFQQLVSAPEAAARQTQSQITLVAEPKEAAQTLIQRFNRSQLTELVQLLQKAIA